MQPTKRRKPKITIGKTDHARLSSLAESALERLPETAEELLSELDRAHVAADRSVPGNVVRMGSQVTFKPDTGDHRTVTLVFPGDADISTGKVSILTPIGTALLGLSSGQAMTWTSRDGRAHELVVLDVSPPEEGASSEPAASTLQTSAGR
ncbi:MAG: nucleoside diphosphate kinase regulator [Rhizobiaceae bacterium]|jgi:regulator of nucleoside diphosphate kinase|nr:nucleoside diphosphate kinase regulator [Rhizobiaceae bacterium]